MQSSNLAFKRTCTFIMLLTHPMQTVSRVSELLHRKGVTVDSLQVQVLDNGEARLLIYCAIEKDRIGYIGRHFEEMPGVRAVDWMNARTRVKQY